MKTGAVKQSQLDASDKGFLPFEDEGLQSEVDVANEAASSSSHRMEGAREDSCG